ncbi:nucleotidyltransferase domain-containing protein [Kineococcus glutinatus]|uniref:nucleotidyltransferase domain-containing protein n=1 Tax=Kineococcus glutinatus TaxID=1070872 RepID=UPI0031EC412C
MSARMKGRHRETERLLTDLTRWAQDQVDVHAVALVGSHARGRARMASDVDLVVLSPAFARLAADTTWFTRLRPGSRHVRSATWGPLLERRHRLRSGLLVELGLAAPEWAALPLDAGTHRVLRDGHRVLHDRHGLLARAAAALDPGAGAPATP